MNVNINDKLYGFQTQSINRIDDIDANLVDMIHEKSGARLLYLDRQDENATFTIAFRTTPTDDTGVFHILEHSVLCGSKKYPIKDPFTELSKGSVSTYLNALTAGDKTLYPVASKNPKAFLGMVDVYLDAVFNPLVLENPFIFMQEGYRYELADDGTLSVTGVVYNEMKGVYSSADDYADYLISKRICPGGTYSYDAGGHPDFITELTYEDFKRAHGKYYHPSNSCIYLDGDVNLDEILPLIDGYLSAYDKTECDVRVDNGGAPITEVGTFTYPIEKGEDTEDKTRVYLSYNSFAYGKYEENTALSLISEVLADLNTAPLTKIILDTGLCESFALYPTLNNSLNGLNAFFTGVKDGKENEVIEVFDNAVKDIIKNGIPKDILSAAIARREFKTREADYGSHPLGMVYMRSLINSALLGEAPDRRMRYEDVFAFLREKLDTGYYEQTLKEVISSPRSTLILHPDPDFNEKKEGELKEKLRRIAEAMSEEEKTALRQENESFRIWQNTPDNPEDVAKIPALSIDDLNITPKDIPTEITEYRESKILSHPLSTNGISYVVMLFDLSDADEDELHHLGLFADLVFEWNTAKSSADAFKNKTKAHLGAFSVNFHKAEYDGEARLYFFIHFSCLNSEKENALAIIEEYLYSTLYNDKEVLKQNLKQIYTGLSEDIAARGNSYASMRTLAKLSTLDAIAEHTSGYSYHSFIKELLGDIDAKADGTLARFNGITDKYFRRERLILSIVENDGVAFAKQVIDTVRCGGEKSAPSPVKPLKMINDGIAVPTGVSFTYRAGRFGDRSTGAYNVLSSIASHELLWNEIRLKNGAYDTGFHTVWHGLVGCYSYRDPSPAASLEYYERLCDDMSDFLDTDPDLYKYIIGIFGSLDTVTTPRMDGFTATKRYLSGTTYEDVVNNRKACRETTVGELKEINSAIKNALSHSPFTVVGPREELEKIDGIEEILEI